MNDEKTTSALIFYTVCCLWFKICRFVFKLLHYLSQSSPFFIFICFEFCTLKCYLNLVYFNLYLTKCVKLICLSFLQVYHLVSYSPFQNFKLKCSRLRYGVFLDKKGFDETSNRSFHGHFV